MSMTVDFKADYESQVGPGVIEFSMIFPENIDPAEAVAQAAAQSQREQVEDLPPGTFRVFNVRLA